MPIYTGTADANGDFNISFGSSSYTSSEKITVTAEKDSAEKSIELYAPSEVVGGGVIQFTGNLSNFPANIGGIKISGLSGGIGNSAFYAQLILTNLFRAATSLEIATGVTSIGSSAFYNWAGIKSLSLPAGLLSIGASAFYNASSLLSLVIPDSVTSIGASAFQSMAGIASLTLSNSCNIIENACFSGMTAIKKIDIPANVTTIGTQSFSHATSCDELICRAVIPPTIQSNTFQSLKSTCIIKVPSASVAAYQAAPNWSVFASRIQAI